MPRSRTRKGGRRKRSKRSGVVGLVPKTLRKAITKVNKAARSAARGVDSKLLIKAPKMVLGPILKSRLGGRKRSKGGRKRKGGGTSCCKRLNPASVSSSTQKKGGRKRRGGSKKRRGGSRKRR